MNEIIPINYDSDRPTVSARELHKFLGIGTKFQDWFPRMIGYGFKQGTDFNPLKIENVLSQKRERTYSATDYQLTIDMAKELCMIQRTEKGKQARQYFLTVEKAWNSPEQIMARALKMADDRIGRLENKIKDDKPKVDYYNEIMNNPGLVTITQIAKDYGMTGTEMNKLLHSIGIQYKESGQWLLYREHQNKGYTHSRTIQYTHTDGTKGIRMNTAWTQNGRLFLYKRLKKINVIPVIEKKEA